MIKDKRVAIFKALANTTRLQIIEDILNNDYGICACNRLDFKLSQPTMWHHIHTLVSADILRVRKKGVCCFYSVNKKLLESIGIDSKIFIPKGGVVKHD